MKRRDARDDASRRPGALPWALALFGLGLAIHVTSLDAPFILDDLSKIVGNPDIRSLRELPEKLVYPYGDYQVLERNDPSRPLVFASYALNYAWGGLEPRGYHVVNALLHALAGVLVFLLARRLLGDRLPRTAAALAAALFLVAPLNVGTSIYVYGRSDVLGAVLLLGATLLYLRPSRAALAGAALLFGAALFTKQSAIVLPALLLVADALARPEPSLRAALARWRRLWPFALVALAWLTYRFTYFGALGDLEGRGNTWPALAYTSTQPWAIARYAQMLLAPAGLALDHQILPESLTTAERVLGAVLLLGASVGAFVLARRKGALGMLAAGGLAWFLLCLAPTSSVMPTVDALVERRAYLASAGFFLALVATASTLRPAFARAARVTLVLLAVASAGLSLRRAALHDEPRRLWADVIETYPRSVRAHNNLANLLLEAGQAKEALAIFEQLVAWNPGDFIARNNVGNLYAREDLGLFDEARALEALEAAVALNPGYAAPHYNLGRLYQRRGHAARAERHYLRALEIQPGYVLAHNNLGLLYFHAGRREDARVRYERALALDPGCGPARFNLELLERTPSGAEPRGLAPSTPRPPAPTPPGEKLLAGQLPEKGARPVPVDAVPSETLTALYEEALRRDPQNRAVRRKYADLCRARALPCARPQYERLLRDAPDDAEVRALLDALPR